MGNCPSESSSRTQSRVGVGWPRSRPRRRPGCGAGGPASGEGPRPRSDRGSRRCRRGCRRCRRRSRIARWRVSHRGSRSNDGRRPRSLGLVVGGGRDRNGLHLVRAASFRLLTVTASRLIHHATPSQPIVSIRLKARHQQLHARLKVVRSEGFRRAPKIGDSMISVLQGVLEFTRADLECNYWSQPRSPHPAQRTSGYGFFERISADRCNLPFASRCPEETALLGEPSARRFASKLRIQPGAIHRLPDPRPRGGTASQRRQQRLHGILDDLVVGVSGPPLEFL